MQFEKLFFLLNSTDVSSGKLVSHKFAVED